mgnify:CR=1 FL=1
MSLTPHQILQGKTLETILKELIASHGFRNLARALPLRCFMFEPTLVSSLRFLRKNPEARAQVEAFYVAYKQQG